MSPRYQEVSLADEKAPSVDDSRRSLESDDTENQPLTGSSKPWKTTSRWPSLRVILACIAAQLAFLVIYTIVLVKALGVRTCSSTGSPQHIISSPANEAIRWEPKYLDTRLRQQDEYVGGPTPEVDKAWNDLIDLSNIKVPSSEISRIGKTSIQVPDEPGQSWATLGVIHELHCLGRLRMSIYMDHYYPDFTEEDKKLNQAHSEHCIDYLRQAAMCHGDVSLTTYHWQDDQIFPVADFNSSKACVNWDVLADWQRERLWDPMEPGYLKHPKLGAPFPDGNGTLIGVSAHQLNGTGGHSHHSGRRSPAR
ncbi:hypothetical protein GGS20DRAFT_333095 [Poronia punctata]|nr:hypothetical protein GGS20DRAFT_333095 [Poronia punctata]